MGEIRPKTREGAGITCGKHRLSSSPASTLWSYSSRATAGPLQSALNVLGSNVRHSVYRWLGVRIV